MKAIVVYESHWGNTSAIAREIAEGLGAGARALTTSEAAGDVIADVDLIVAGAPLLGFSLPTEAMHRSIATTAAPVPPDMTQPSMRSWLDGLGAGHGRSAAFETRFRWSPGSATSTIERSLERAGYPPVAKAAKFVVTGKYGPLKDGERERARAWGAELARSVGA